MDEVEKFPNNHDKILRKREDCPIKIVNKTGIDLKTYRVADENVWFIYIDKSELGAKKDSLHSKNNEGST